MWAEEEQALDCFTRDEVAAAAVQFDDDLLLAVLFWVEVHGVANLPRCAIYSTPPPWGLSPRGVLHRCSNVPLCSRNVPAPWNTVSPAFLLAEPPLSYPLFQINRNRYRERRGGSATAALLVLGVYVSGGRNMPPFLPQLAAPPQLAMFQRLRNRRRNTARGQNGSSP